MRWCLSNRADPKARVIADRHYNRQKIGAKQFVPPGRCLVLLSRDEKAFWITSWPFAEYVKHEWGGDWVCSAFRNEGASLSSDLIREAVAVTRWFKMRETSWLAQPEPGMVTFVNRDKVRPKRDPGRCYLKAGFKRVGETKGGLVALRLAVEDMPAPSPPSDPVAVVRGQVLLFAA